MLDICHGDSGPAFIKESSHYFPRFLPDHERKRNQIIWGQREEPCVMRGALDQTMSDRPRATIDRGTAITAGIVGIGYRASSRVHQYSSSACPSSCPAALKSATRSESCSRFWSFFSEPPSNAAAKTLAFSSCSARMRSAERKSQTTVRPRRIQLPTFHRVGDRNLVNSHRPSLPETVCAIL